MFDDSIGNFNFICQLGLLIIIYYNKMKVMSSILLLVVICIWDTSSQGGTLPPTREMLGQIQFEVGKWSSTYGGRYQGSQLTFRTTLATQAAQEIVAFNSQSGQTYKQGINKFSAWTTAEFQAILKYKPLTGAAAVRFTNRRNLAALTAKGNVDWRNAGLVSPVKDQGGCGSCWAFAAIANFESYFLRLKQPLDLSEQMVVDCSQGDNGCDGGNAYYASYDMLKNGVVAETDYPYTAVTQACKVLAASIEYHKYNSVRTTAPGCANIVAAIYNRPMAVSVDASNWWRYKSGIFPDSTNTNPKLNHNVQLVGYYPGQYYLIKNSWSTDFGENGFIRLAPGTTSGICKEGADWVD